MDRPKLQMPLSTGGIDNRRSTRHEVECEVGLETDSNIYMGLTENLSEGGVFVASDELLPLGTRLTLKFKLPNSDVPIACTGEVRWHRSESGENEAGMGVRFIGLNDEASAEIQRFIGDRQPMFHPDS